MSNVFEHYAEKFRNSSFVIWVMLLGIFAIAIGIWHFVEDTQSSIDGLNELERVFGLAPVNYEATYFTMSVAPQIGQVIFAYMYLADTKRNRWFGMAAAAFFLIDFIADVQDRSNGLLFPLDGSTMFDHATPVIIASAMTFLFFTVGSELFITAGVGLFLELFADAVHQAKLSWHKMTQAIERPIDRPGNRSHRERHQ